MMVHFDDLFGMTEDNLLRPKVNIEIDNIIYTPQSYLPLDNIVVSGIKLPELREHLLRVDLTTRSFEMFTIKNIVDNIIEDKVVDLKKMGSS
ncbi:MAG: hypothetical protein V4642_02425 [Bacteroidota bacterium]